MYLVSYYQIGVVLEKGVPKNALLSEHPIKWMTKLHAKGSIVRIVFYEELTEDLAEEMAKVFTVNQGE